MVVDWQNRWGFCSYIVRDDDESVFYSGGAQRVNPKAATSPALIPTSTRVVRGGLNLGHFIATTPIAKSRSQTFSTTSYIFRLLLPLCYIDVINDVCETFKTFIILFFNKIIHLIKNWWKLLKQLLCAKIINIKGEISVNHSEFSSAKRNFTKALILCVVVLLCVCVWTARAVQVQLCLAAKAKMCPLKPVKHKSTFCAQHTGAANIYVYKQQQR